MCICVFYKDASPKSLYNIILIHNRDEYFDRPSTCINLNDSQIYAGLDLTSNLHGNWLGINKKGNIGILLNIPKSNFDKTHCVSRGKIIQDVINFTNTQDIRTKLQHYQSLNYQYLHLMSKNNPLKQTYYFVNYENNLQEFILKPEIYAFGNSKYVQTTLMSPNYDIPNIHPKWQKLNRALSNFIEVISAQHTAYMLMVELDKILIDKTKCYPDPAYELEFCKDYGQSRDTIYNKASIFVEPFILNNRIYGTRCRTVILIDKKGKAYVMETSFKSSYLDQISTNHLIPENILNKELWEITKFEFQLE